MCPPNAKLFFKAIVVLLISILILSRGIFRLIYGSIGSEFRLAGIKPMRRALIVSIVSTAPDPPSKWPRPAFGAETGTTSERVLNTLLIAKDSAKSPDIVPVAWADIISISEGCKSAAASAFEIEIAAYLPSLNGLAR